MKQVQHTLSMRPREQGLLEITGEVAAWVRGQGIGTGLLTVFCKHTSASLIIQENADSDVQRDLETFFSGLVREDPALYHHTTEGPDDMPAHIRSVLTATQLSIPVAGGRMALGTWQGIYLFEHRARPPTRLLLLHVVGE